MDPLYNVKQRMGELVQFILNNLKKPVTQEIQVEFNILYDYYTKALNEAYEKHAISEELAVKMQIKSPVEIPSELMDEFEEWFSERMNSMIETDWRKHGKSLNN